MKIYDADVVVVAGGPAGLAAANAAAENGVKVVLLEKANVTGGAGNMGMGPFGVGTRLQRKRMVGLTTEEAFDKFMAYTHWRVDAGLVRDYIEKSASTIEWLQEMGVQFADVARYFPGSEATWHMVKPPSGNPGPRSASIMYKLMTQRAEELGVEILLETPAKKIIMENGRAAGVMAVNKSGEEVKVTAKAVIIATGGFGDNPQMIREYLGYEWGKDLFSFRIPGLVGDGIRMAWEVGAGSTDVNMELTFGNPDMGETPISDLIFHQPSMLCLNLSGERFMNEDLLENVTWAGNAITRLQNHCAFAIFDSSVLKYYCKNGLDLESLVFGDLPMDQVEPELEKAAGKGSGNVVVADSLEDLAKKTGIPEDALREAVETYNRGCQNKEDEFYKKSRHLRPLKGPKYFAGKLLPGGYGTLGGIKINRKTEVLTKDYKVIPGIYAAGTDACSIYADSYVFILPGNTMGFALNSGRIAGENAASYVEK